MHTLYVGNGCHACESLKSVLERDGTLGKFVIRNIDQDPEARVAYHRETGGGSLPSARIAGRTFFGLNAIRDAARTA